MLAVREVPARATALVEQERPIVQVAQPAAVIAAPGAAIAPVAPAPVVVQVVVEIGLVAAKFHRGPAVVEIGVLLAVAGRVALVEVVPEPVAPEALRALEAVGVAEAVREVAAVAVGAGGNQI